MKVLELLRIHQPIARRELAALLKIAPATASVHLQSLKRQGLATGSGHGCGSVWRLCTGRRAGAAGASGPMVNDVFSFAASL